MEETTVKTAVPMTPMRRLWCKFQVLRSSQSLALGKRHRGVLQPAEQRNSASLASALDISASLPNTPRVAESSSKESVIAEEDGEGVKVPETLQLNTPVKQHAGAEPAGRARVAIQQSDSRFDAVVVTTLPRYPFYCHDDLIKMSRPELVATADLFNAHLPGAMRIEASDNVSDVCIRRAIEMLVGIIPSTPGAPKAIRKMHSDNDRFRKTKSMSPPSSPLAMRVSRRGGLANMAGSSIGHLERLDEVDESDFFTNHRPLKRRKVSDVLATPTFFERQRMIVDTPLGRHTTSRPDISILKSPGSPTGLSPDLGMVSVSY